MLIELTMILNIDIDDTMKKLMQSTQAIRQLMAILNALSEFDKNDQNKDKTGIWLAMAS
jgi:hypothetical protein